MAVLDLSFESKDDSLSVRHFEVSEALSELFDVSVVACSANEDLDLEAFVGRSAAFSMVGSLSTGRFWTGIVREIEQIEVEAPTAGALGLSTYLIHIVPTLWLTTQRRGHRIFQHLSVPEIVDKILGEYSIETKKTLSEDHPAHDYRVQYGETDFAFISRILEEEGISYYFAQAYDDDGGKTTLVLIDRPHTADLYASIPYVDNPNQAAQRTFLSNVNINHGVRAGRFTIRDYDFQKPDYLLLGKAALAPAGTSEDTYERYHYEHGAFADDKAGQLRATVGLERARRSKRQVSFSGNAFDLSPGQIFTFLNHPRTDLGVDKRLLVLRQSIEGSATGEWTMSGEAVFAAEPYRPDLSTPRPRIAGVESAVVVGPKGEEIHTDEHGRVRVQFHWDREGKLDDKSSCWIRVSQGWAGAGYGMIALPRVGQEVLVSFWEGNPDQPVVVGRVYNAKNKLPYKLPDQKTKSGWRTNSSPHTGGYNEIMMEDRAGSELFSIHAQKDLTKLVKNNEDERTGSNRTISVGQNRTSTIGATDAILVGSKYSVAMGAAGGAAPVTTIEMVEGRITLSTGKASIELDGDKITLKAEGDINLKAGGDLVIQGGPFVKLNC